MTDPEEVIVSSRVALLAETLRAATEARARWSAEEERLKKLILDELGYDENDEKPVPVKATDMAGHELFRVSIGTWRGLDQKAFKREHPSIYAEFETSKPTKSIKTGGAFGS